MKLQFYLGFFLMALLLTSCATIFTGSTQTIAINSTPSDAKVEVNGLNYGRTPTTIKMKRAMEGDFIKVSKEGYKPVLFQPQTSINPVAIINLLNGLFWLIDLLTGAVWRYSPAMYDIILEPAIDKI